MIDRIRQAAEKLTENVSMNMEHVDIVRTLADMGI
jgi:hypothetical protein